MRDRARIFLPDLEGDPPECCKSCDNGGTGFSSRKVLHPFPFRPISGNFDLSGVNVQNNGTELVTARLFDFNAEIGMG